MIFEAILTWFRDFVVAQLATIQIPGVPEWAASTAATLGLVLQWAAPLCGWVAWDLADKVLGTTLAVFVFAFGASILRQVVSAVTPGGFGGGGGSA